MEYIKSEILCVPVYEEPNIGDIVKSLSNQELIILDETMKSSKCKYKKHVLYVTIPEVIKKKGEKYIYGSPKSDIVCGVRIWDGSELTCFKTKNRLLASSDNNIQTQGINYFNIIPQPEESFLKKYCDIGGIKFIDIKVGSYICEDHHYSGTQGICRHSKCNKFNYPIPATTSMNKIIIYN